MEVSPALTVDSTEPLHIAHCAHDCRVPIVKTSAVNNTFLISQR